MVGGWEGGRSVTCERIGKGVRLPGKESNSTNSKGDINF
jgi:hypothetical protein